MPSLVKNKAAVLTLCVSAGANQPALQNKVMHIAYGNAPYNAGISGQNGWVAGRTYDFSFTMTETSLQIFVSDNGAAPVEVFNINNGPSSVGPIMGSRPWPYVILSLVK